MLVRQSRLVMAVVHHVPIVSKIALVIQPVAATVATAAAVAVAIAVVLENVYYVRVDGDNGLVHDVYYEMCTPVYYDHIAR
jgi:hypothetical protein